MRKETIVLYERDFAYCLAGQLFEQAPNRKPRKAEVIMQKALESFNNYEKSVPNTPNDKCPICTVPYTCQQKYYAEIDACFL